MHTERVIHNENKENGAMGYKLKWNVNSKNGLSDKFNLRAPTEVKENTKASRII